MLMADRASRDNDLSSLRVVFTGGESLPYRPAAEFEKLTGAMILQFYGSNETGLLSATTVNDSQERRLRTAGRIVPEMSVRLFDVDQDVTETGQGSTRLSRSRNQPGLSRGHRPRPAVHP